MKNYTDKFALIKFFYSSGKIHLRSFMRGPTIQRQRHQQKDVLGAFLLTCILAGGVAPFFSLSFVYTCLDSFYYVLEEILPHPYDRSVLVIVVSACVRFLLFLVCCCEFCRFSLYLLFLFAIIALSALSTVNMLLWLPGNGCLRFYVQLRIILDSIYFILRAWVGILTVVAHFTTVFSLWLFIRSRKYIPLLVSTTSIVAGVVLVIYATIIFSASGKGRTIAEAIIRKKMIAYFSRRASKLNKRYYCYSLWKAQIPVGVPCGSFFVVQRSFAMAYLRELATNLVNAVLLIKPIKM